MSEVTEANNRTIRRLTERIDDVVEDAVAYGVQPGVISATLISTATHVLELSHEDAQAVAEFLFARLKK